MYQFSYRLRRLILALGVIFASTLLAACGGGTSAGLLSGGVTVGPQQVYLAWLPHPDPSVNGYLVYFGRTLDSATQVISDLSTTTPGFNPQAPFAMYHISVDLGMQAGDTACFRLAAYNLDGVSNATIGVCTTV